MKDITIENDGQGGIVLYQTDDGRMSLDVKLVWISVSQMAQLFDREDSNILRHHFK